MDKIRAYTVVYIFNSVFSLILAIIYFVFFDSDIMFQIAEEHVLYYLFLILLFSP